MPIRKNAPMSTYINDFRKSDAPQFQGKSEDKRDEMAIAAKLQAMDKMMEEGTNKYQPLFNDLYTKYKDTLNTLEVHNEFDLMDKVRKNNKFMDIYKLLPNHRKQVDAYIASLKPKTELTEKKATYCYACKHTHVKGTACLKEEAAMTDMYDDAPELKGGQKRLPDMLQKAIVDKVVGKIKEAALTINYDNPTQTDDILNISTAADTTAAANTFKTSPSFKGTVKNDKGKVLVRRENLAEGLERDYEGEMAKSQLFSIVKNAKELFDMIDNSTQLEGWVQSKLTKAEDYLSAVTSYLEGQSITSTTPVMVAEEAIKDEEGSSLSVGDVVKAGDGGIYQIIYSHSMSKPFLVPFDLKKKRIGNLRTKIAFDSDSMIPKKLHKVMSHSATKGGFTK
jgi:hypothetical protein